MNLSLTRQNAFACGLVVLIFILSAWDIGNLDQLRQGTEGFYLQITKEMWLESSWMTPLYNGAPHWSKPPLHFWLPFPLFAFDSLTFSTAGRLAILIFSFFGLGLLARWVSRTLHHSAMTSFLIFVSCLGFFKYSRIFMMEMPLVITCTLGSVYLYSVIMEGRPRDLMAAIFWSALAVLVKGPVAWVMIFSSGGLFLVVRWHKGLVPPFKNLILYSVGTIGLGSIWFFISYANYGSEFLDYFFGRENLGKFSSKSYPIRVLFQGLFIFAFPWSLYFLAFIKKPVKDLICAWPQLFLLIHTTIFFFLWMIPSQRSHHYAIPSMYFFIILIMDQILFNPMQRHRLGALIASRLVAVFFFLIGFVFLFSFTLDGLLESFQQITIVILATLLVILSALTFWKQLSVKWQASSAAVSFAFITSLTAPQFILPALPEVERALIADRHLAVALRKPFFIEEAIERPIDLLIDATAIEKALPRVKDLILMRESDFMRVGMHERFEIKEEWIVWKKGQKFKEIRQALLGGNVADLQEKMIIAELKKPTK